MLKTFGRVRFVYNQTLAARRDAYDKNKRSLSTNDCVKMLPGLKEQYPWFKEVDCVESFNVAGMLKNHHLAKAIADCSWGELCRQLKYRSILTNEFFLFAYNKGR